MSFSSDTKAELCRQAIQKKCCAQAEAYGVLLYCNLFSEGEIRIVTGSPEFAARLPRLFKKAFNISLDSKPQGEQGGKAVFSLTDRDAICRIFQAYGYEPDTILAHHINLGMLEENCCKLSFLRGAFLAGGSISSPEKSYHLEIVTPHFNVSREVFSMLLELDFVPKDTSRGGNYIIYFKQSDAIEEFLTRLGAPLSAMNIMSAKVEKDMRNTINRRVNCDSANADKIVSAAQEQIEAIKRIDRSLGLTELPDRLREAALLRIANPESSIAELAALAVPSVTKSCMSHRLRKLMEFDEKQDN